MSSLYITDPNSPTAPQANRPINNDSDFDASVDSDRSLSPINFGTVESGLRKRRKLVEDVLVCVLCRPIRQMLAALRFGDAVLRHEVQPIPQHHLMCRF